MLGLVYAGQILRRDLLKCTMRPDLAALAWLILFKLTAAMNGGVMFLYSGTLLYLNYFKLPRHIATSWWRALIMAWSVAFFGFFAIWAVWDTVIKMAG